MSVEQICACGRQLRISDAHAGRQVKCPGCGALYTVPDRSGITQHPAAAGPSATISILASPQPRARKTLAIVLSLVLLLAFGAAAWWFFFRGPEPIGPDISDLSLIPPNAQGFASIRLAELWQTPAAQKAIEEERTRNPRVPGFADRMERDTGLRPEQVERLSLVVQEFDKDQPEPVELGWLVFGTFEPYDRSKVLSWLRRSREIRYGDRTYHLGEDRDGREVAVHLAGPRVLVVASEAGVKRCLDYLANPARSGPLQPLIARCEEPHHGVGGLLVSDDMRAQLRENRLIPALAEVLMATATLNIQDQAVLEVRGQLSNVAEAKKLQQALPGIIGLARFMLPMLAMKAPGEQGKMLMRMAPMLGKLKTEQKGNEVVGTIRTDAAEVMRAILQTATRQ